MASAEPMIQTQEARMASAIERFFQGYVAAFNRSLGDAVDVEGIRSHFSECFVAAGPGGVQCGRNDESFAATLQQGYAFYKSIGTKAMSVRDVVTTPIDEAHQMARVAYRATYERTSGESVAIDFAVTYLLEAADNSFRVFGFVAGDETALYREHGLLPAGEAVTG